MNHLKIAHQNIKAILLAATFFCTAHARAQSVGLDKTAFTTLRQLATTDKAVGNMYNDFLKKAKAALSDKPNPRDTIVSEGHLKSHPDKIASEEAMKDFGKIYALAIAYMDNGQQQYLDKATGFLTAWATTNHPLGKPINDTKLDNVIAAYDMLRTHMSANDKQTIDKWLCDIAEEEMKKNKKGAATSMNNWHSHRLKVVGEIGYTINSNKYKDYASRGLLTQIETNLNADGSSWDFWERDALHYHAYDMEPLLTLAIIVNRATGANDFTYVSPKGTSIRQSVDWFVPYVTGEKTHAEFIHSKVAFDRARADNNEKGFATGENFVPRKGLGVLSLAAYFDPTYLKTIQEVTKSDSEFYDWQSVLNKVSKAK